MFRKIKFQILSVCHEETMKHYAIDLKRMGVRVTNIKVVDIRNESENKFCKKGVLTCVAPLKVYERVKKFYTVVI